MNERRIVRIAARIVAVDLRDALTEALRDMVEKAGLTEGDNAHLIVRGMEVPSFTRGLGKVVERAGAKWGFGSQDDALDDAVQVVIEDFYRNPRHSRFLLKLRGETWKRVGVALNKMLYNNVSQVLRAESLRREKLVSDIPDEPEGKLEPSGEMMNVMMDDLRAYVRAQSDKMGNEMLRVYLNAVKRRGTRGVQMKRDVYPVLWEKGFRVKEAQMSKEWVDLKKLVVKFFEKELGKRVSDKGKRMLRVAFRRRFYTLEFRSV